MSDKIHMSLDEIISKEKKSGRSNFVGSKRRNTRVGGSKKVGGRRVNQNMKNAGLNKAATVRLVNKLVKKAIRQRTNGPPVNRAARNERRNNKQISANRPVLIGRRFANRSRLTGRLGVSRQSKVAFKRNMNRVQRVQKLAATSQVMRGRGVARLGQLVSDGPIESEQQMFEVLPVVERRNFDQRHMIVERMGRNRFQNAEFNGVRKGNFASAPRFIVVDDEAQIANGGKQQFVRGLQNKSNFNFNRRGFVNPNVERMRNALGIGKGRGNAMNREPVNSFLQRVPVRGRRRTFYQ